MRELFVTGGTRNMEIRLWKLKTLQLIQTVQFVSSEGNSFAEQHGNHLAFDSSCQFLYAAHTKEDFFCILHLRPPEYNEENRTLVFDNVRFDYLSEFVLVSTDTDLPIRSLVITNEIRMEESREEMIMYYCQALGVSKFQISPEHCYLPYQDEPATLTETITQTPIQREDSSTEEEHNKEKKVDVEKKDPLDERKTETIEKEPPKETTKVTNVTLQPEQEQEADLPLNTTGPSLPRTQNIPIPVQVPQPQPSVPTPTSSAQTSRIATTTAILSVVQSHHTALLTKLAAEGKERNQSFNRWLNTETKNYTQNYLPKMVEGIVANQLNNVLVPSLKESLGKTLEEKVRKNFAQLVIPRVEIVIKETIEKTSTSTVKNVMNETLKENFMNVLTPAFEKSFQNMFQQLNATLTNELEGYFQTAEKLRTKKITDDNTSQLENQVVKDLTSSLTSLSDLTERMNKCIVDTQMKMQNGDTDDKLIKKEIQTFNELTIKKKINGFLAQKNYEDAFVLALTQNNLDLLYWLISSVEPHLIFSHRVLSKGVIISLVQQIGCNLSTNVQKKLDWLFHCLVELDEQTIHDGYYGPYITSILQELISNLSFINDPEHLRICNLLKHNINVILSSQKKT
eukprot:TRINITY_DN1226_c1_g1_i1.p1 TRINITY_DN1226_c1_g1~~TRINITY_DN1226_c1_g1_i1.p1  ORF type:complete len:667 (-),score=161.07 TRINITY_DN1226_c1_g1_i1:78-1952(-)